MTKENTEIYKRIMSTLTRKWKCPTSENKILCYSKQKRKSQSGNWYQIKENQRQMQQKMLQKMSWARHRFREVPHGKVIKIFAT